jgi:hypothetical protein
LDAAVRRALRGSAAGLALAVSAVTACQTAPRQEEAVAEQRALREGPEQAVADQRALRDWLECEECWEGELEKVVALGDRAVPSLSATLQEGMSPAARARLSRQLAERYAERVAWAQEHPEAAVTMSRDEYVRHHVDNRDALYRVRSIRALAAIGTPAALRALREELERTPHEGIREEIRRALEGTV